MKHLQEQESTGLSRTFSLSNVEATWIILRVNLWKFFLLFFLGPSCSIMCSSYLESSLFCSSYSFTWRKIVLLRRPRTARLSTAGGGGMTLAAAAQVALGIEMHAW